MKHLDAIDIPMSIFSRGVDFRFDSFHFSRWKKTLGYSVVGAVALTAYSRDQVVTLIKAAPSRAAVLAPVIRPLPPAFANAPTLPAAVRQWSSC